MSKLNVLVACEYSGTVRDAFIEAGHNAISCDLLPTDNIRERMHYMPPSPDRWKLRSKTYDGIAKAMASQWSTIRRSADLLEACQ